MKTMAILTILLLNLFLLAAALPSSAQETALPDGEYVRVSYNANSNPAPTSAITGEPNAADPASPASPQGGTAQGGTGTDNQWHLSVSPYLWFAGAHGTVNVLNRGVGFSASPADLLSKLRFGLMGAVEARKSRFLLSADAMWIGLKVDHATPFPNVGATSATIKATEFLLTPKVGVRLYDGKMIKADAMAGIRYWHFGETLNFVPGTLGLDFSRSQDMVDPLVGGRITATLAPKVVFTLGGDVGGWDTGSHLEYQVAGLLGYKVKPNTILQLGYRYLNLDYIKGGTVINSVNVTTSGVMLGVTFNLK